MTTTLTASNRQNKGLDIKETCYPTSNAQLLMIECTHCLPVLPSRWSFALTACLEIKQELVDEKGRMCVCTWVFFRLSHYLSEARGFWNQISWDSLARVCVSEKYICIKYIFTQAKTRTMSNSVSSCLVIPSVTCSRRSAASPFVFVLYAIIDCFQKRSIGWIRLAVHFAIMQPAHAIR